MTWSCEIRDFRVPSWISILDQKKKGSKRLRSLEDKIPKNNFVLDFHQSSMMGLMKLLSIGFHTFFFGSYWYPGCVESVAEKQSPRHILTSYIQSGSRRNQQSRPKNTSDRSRKPTSARYQQKQIPQFGPNPNGNFKVPRQSLHCTNDRLRLNP